MERFVLDRWSTDGLVSLPQVGFTATHGGIEEP